MAARIGAASPHPSPLSARSKPSLFLRSQLAPYLGPSRRPLCRKQGVRAVPPERSCGSGAYADGACPRITCKLLDTPSASCDDIQERSLRLPYPQRKRPNHVRSYGRAARNFCPGSLGIWLWRGRLSTAGETRFCGFCHRTAVQEKRLGIRGVENVRFQGYRLERSRCYNTEDHRIRCTACHDPHRPVVTRVAYYDAKCLACHARRGGAAAPPCGEHLPARLPARTV